MLTIDQLQKNYPNFKLDLSLTIPTGKISGILGPNGAGKSTFFKLLLGLITPDQGQILIEKQPLATWLAARPENISATFPDSGFNENLIITEISQLLTAFYPAFVSSDFLTTCQQLNLPLNQATKTFSTGMQAELKVLIALAHPAKLLILDEPTTGLDVGTRQIIIQLIQDYHLHYPESTILVSSHIASDIEALAEQTVIITDGRLKLQASWRDIQQHYGLFSVSQTVFSQLDQTKLSKLGQQANQVTCLTSDRQAFATMPTLKTPTIDDLLLAFTATTKAVVNA